MSYPTISINTPTLNAESVLEKCLESISSQDYPKDKVEIIIADGGSKDNTVKIAKNFGAKVVKNPRKTGESGKAEALKHAHGEIVALIDSDNILPDGNWLKIMTKPFSDDEIIAAEPIEYTYRKGDPILTRYFALLGMNDPICLFLGNYDRYSVLTGKWTGLKFSQTDKGIYLKVKLDHEPVPTIGANGFLIRHEALTQVAKDDYLFDIDVLVQIIRKKGYVNVAKVKTGIIHTFVENDPFKFFRKQLRRINDMSFHHVQGSRQIDWQSTFFWRIIWFQLQCLLVFPILYQTLKGFLAKPDPAWFFHPIACYSTWFIYLYGWIKGKIRPEENSRHNWRQ